MIILAVQAFPRQEGHHTHLESFWIVLYKAHLEELFVASNNSQVMSLQGKIHVKLSTRIVLHKQQM